MLRSLALAAPVCALLCLSACGPAGVVANSMVKETQGRNAGDIERDLLNEYGKHADLRGVKVSVAINNVWQNAFQTRYSILLAGTIPDRDARAAAIAILRRVIGGDDEAIVIADRMRETGRASE